jgi:hypothetical protein
VVESKEKLAELESRREEIRARMVAVGELRPGSLVEMYRKCGKANCRCAKPGHPGHGPSYIVTHKEAGVTVTRTIPADGVKTASEQIAEYRRFRKLAQEFVAINEAVCDARLRDGGASVADTTGKKNASRRPSTRKSSTKSKV